MKISYHFFLTIEIVMILFIYDKTLDGLLTALFDAYNRKTFPDVLLSKGDTLPLFYDDIFQEPAVSSSLLWGSPRSH